MTSVNFLETQMVNCKFIDCELSKIAAAFNECDLSSVNFINCNMDYVKFCFAFLNNVFASGCNLKCADFGRAKLEKAMFVRCNMSEAVFDEAQFDEAECKESDLTKLSAKHIVRELLRLIEVGASCFNHYRIDTPLGVSTSYTMSTGV